MDNIAFTAFGILWNYHSAEAEMLVQCLLPDYSCGAVLVAKAADFC